MEERLLGARFRYLNQQLYTGSSRDAARLFRADPAAFHLYHRGFEQQVRRWPERPVERIVRYLRRRSYFFLLEFTKTGPARASPTPGLRLRPCLYKRR
ncbi:hypothetical protein WISP_41266 [Willisornis vidua]|uniref:Ribosomal RNA-processing protein 8 n=1 Tax=Willisornis vidua TaxID=1566151 RepID=A0ABQ9DMI1_9PASS|nr:hypothetical protein WISP_41266 [Willisornis vidua]